MVQAPHLHMGTIAATQPTLAPILLEAELPRLAAATSALRAALQYSDTSKIPGATRDFIKSLAEHAPQETDYKTQTYPLLSQQTPPLASLLASSQRGRAIFFLSLREIIEQMKTNAEEVVASPFHPKVPPSQGSMVTTLNGILHHLATTENENSSRPVRAAAIKLLNQDVLTPVGSMVLVLAEALDPDIKSEAARGLLTHLLFPLSSSTKDEIRVIHAHAGALLISLCKGVDMSCSKPAWLMQMPELMKQWQLACSATHVDSGINSETLKPCSVARNGPLQEWQIHRAASPNDLLCLTFFQAKLRQLAGR